jgi:hypothetical protein
MEGEPEDEEHDEEAERLGLQSGGQLSIVVFELWKSGFSVVCCTFRSPHTAGSLPLPGVAPRQP